MPRNTVYVGRPTKWGNPFKADAIGRQRALSLYRLFITQKLSEATMKKVLSSRGGKVVIADNQAIAFLKWSLVAGILRKDHFKELRGKNLACFCRLDQPCHADILLKLVNDARNDL